MIAKSREKSNPNEQASESQNFKEVDDSKELAPVLDSEMPPGLHQAIKEARAVRKALHIIEYAHSITHLSPSSPSASSLTLFATEEEAAAIVGLPIFPASLPFRNTLGVQTLVPPDDDDDDLYLLDDDDQDKEIGHTEHEVEATNKYVDRGGEDEHAAAVGMSATSSSGHDTKEDRARHEREHQNRRSRRLAAAVKLLRRCGGSGDDDGVDEYAQHSSRGNHGDEEEVGFNARPPKVDTEVHAILISIIFFFKNALC